MRAFGWRNGRLEGVREHDDLVVASWYVELASERVRQLLAVQEVKEIVTGENLGIERVHISPDLDEPRAGPGTAGGARDPGSSRYHASGDVSGGTLTSELASRPSLGILAQGSGAGLLPHLQNSQNCPVGGQAQRPSRRHWGGRMGADGRLGKQTLCQLSCSRSEQG